MSYEHLRVERHGPVGWLINNRPDQLNAMNARMRDEFADAWIELDADPAVRVIVHTGEGRAFQTGVDVTEIATDGVGMQRYRDSVEHFDLHFTAWHQHVVEAGHHRGERDLLRRRVPLDRRRRHRHRRVATPRSSTRTCRSARSCRSRPSGSCARCPSRRSCGWRSSAGTSGCPRPARYELGMISQVVDPPEQLRDAAQALAEKIARNSPAAMAATKRALWGALEAGLTDACRAGAQELVALWGHPDQAEGPRAFAEHREARWADPTGPVRPPGA